LLHVGTPLDEAAGLQMPATRPHHACASDGSAASARVSGGATSSSDFSDTASSLPRPGDGDLVSRHGAAAARELADAPDAAPPSEPQLVS
jgi:hypothetical protein